MTCFISGGHSSLQSGLGLSPPSWCPRPQLPGPCQPQLCFLTRVQAPLCVQLVDTSSSLSLARRPVSCPPTVSPFPLCSHLHSPLPPPLSEAHQWQPALPLPPLWEPPPQISPAPQPRSSAPAPSYPRCPPPTSHPAGPSHWGLEWGAQAAPTCSPSAFFTSWPHVQWTSLGRFREEKQPWKGAGSHSDGLGMTATQTVPGGTRWGHTASGVGQEPPTPARDVAQRHSPSWQAGGGEFHSWYQEKKNLWLSTLVARLPGTLARQGRLAAWQPRPSPQC